MESLIERFDLDLRDAVDERRERSVRLKYAELRMISVYEELQVQCIPLNGSPDNGSIRLIVQYMAGPLL